MFRSKLSLTTGTAVLTIGLFIFAASCNKKEKETVTTTEDSGYASEQSVAEKSFDDAQSIADQANNVTSGNLGYKTTGLTAGSCATVTRSGDTTVIDFGTTNCMCHDGRNRRGKIIVVKVGAYSATGSVKTITFNNYYQNDNQVTGTKTITNMGNNSAGVPYFNITVSGSVVLASGAGTITTNWTRVRTWIAGSATPTDWTDDAYTISGSGTMTRPSGAVVSINIATATPLLVKYGCRWIEAGEIVYILPSGLTRTINFGSNTAPVCDATAVLTLPSGVTRTITMP
ncbi:MAG: hypothetical protein H7257_00435 [Taibaiella sp.]|nr:hypothetical protein [Taibaiella sp.]